MLNRCRKGAQILKREGELGLRKEHSDLFVRYHCYILLGTYSVPGTTSYVSHLTPTTSLGDGYYIIPTFQMKILRLQMIKSLI